MALPDPKTYEKEYEFFPWGILIDEISDIITTAAEENAKIIDLMCGPGHLLGKVREKRPDLDLYGIDIRKDYIRHARNNYPKIRFRRKDVFRLEPKRNFQFLTCNGGLHHIHYSMQERFISMLPGFLEKDGMVLAGDPYVGTYTSESERKEKAIELGIAVSDFARKKGAPGEIIYEAHEIMESDINLEEFKTSLDRILPMFKKYFSKVDVIKTWPNEKTDYGDHYIIARR